MEKINQFPDVINNRKRAEKAKQAMANAGYAENGDLSDDICDLLADLRHLCRQKGIDLDELIRDSEIHFDAETER